MVARVLAAYERIRPLVRETPVEYSPALSAYLKLEHLQHTGSFKFRGAANKIALLTGAQRSSGVVAASNGNHGLGVAAAAQARGVNAEVFVSSQVDADKLRRMELFGARVRVAGDDPLAAELAARREADASGRVFISPYNDLDVVAGQGTIGVELLAQVPQVDAVFVAVGGGGLIGGIGTYLKTAAPGVEIVGCWAANSPVMHRAVEAGRIVPVEESPTLAESTAGGLEPDSVTLELCSAAIDRAVLVEEDEILSAMRTLLHHEHWVVEGAAGVAAAAFLREAGRYAGKHAAIVICGRNVSSRVMGRLMEVS
jgi:threonine dehydratase